MGSNPTQGRTQGFESYLTYFNYIHLSTMASTTYHCWDGRRGVVQELPHFVPEVLPWWLALVWRFFQLTFHLVHASVKELQGGLGIDVSFIPVGFNGLFYYILWYRNIDYPVDMRSAIHVVLVISHELLNLFCYLIQQHISMSSSSTPQYASSVLTRAPHRSLGTCSSPVR